MDTLRDGTPEAAGLDPERIALIRQRATEWVDGERIPASVVLAARLGVVALHQGDGTARHGENVALDSDAVFHCASLAKPVTATAIMMLVEDGLLSLNRPLTDYLPEFHGEHADRVLVHHLLTHTSGFYDVSLSAGEPPVFIKPPDPGTPPARGQHPHAHAVVSFYAGQDCFKKPGTQNAYCSANFSILGDLVRRVSGTRLGEFARARIFEPLGMRSSSIGHEPRLRDRVVMRDPTRPPFDWATLGDDGAAALYSSARDLAVFGQMYLNGGTYGGVRLLNEWTAREMTRNQIPGIGCINFHGRWTPEACWGLGWMIQGDARWPFSHGMLQPRGTYYHQGGSGTGIWIDPLHQLIGVYLAVAYMNPVTHEPNFEFDKFQNMVTAAVVHD